jgi:vesicle coat complex subunit
MKYQDKIAKNYIGGIATCFPYVHTSARRKAVDAIIDIASFKSLE